MYAPPPEQQLVDHTKITISQDWTDQGELVDTTVEITELNSPLDFAGTADLGNFEVNLNYRAHQLEEIRVIRKRPEA